MEKTDTEYKRKTQDPISKNQGAAAGENIRQPEGGKHTTTRRRRKKKTKRRRRKKRSKWRKRRPRLG